MPQTAALPALYERLEKSSDDSVKSAADAAIHRISGAVNTQMPLAEANDLADAYWKASPSLISFPGEENRCSGRTAQATGCSSGGGLASGRRRWR